MPSTLSESAVWGATVTIPSPADPQSASSVNTPIGTLANRTQWLRELSWNSDYILINADHYNVHATPDATNWVRQVETATSGITLWPTWQSSTTSITNSRLIYTVPHPQVTSGGCYLRGAVVYSQHVGTAHTGYPSDPFMCEWYRTDTAGTTKIAETTACDTSSFAAYDAAQSFESTIASGSRPHLIYGPPRIYSMALRAETGTNSAIGRRVRGVQFIFSRVA